MNETNENQNKSKKKSTGKLRTVFKIFRYVNKKDKTILIMSFLAAVCTSLIAPLSTWLLFTPALKLFIAMETQGNPYNASKSDVFSTISDTGHNYFIITVINFLSGFIQIMASETVSRNIMVKIKTDYLAKMLSTEMCRHDESKEQFISTVSNDLQNMMFLMDSKLASAIEMLSSFFFGCVAGFFVSWKVALLSLVLMLITVVVIYFIIQLSKKKRRLQQQYNEKCTKIASEVLGNTRTVTAYCGEHKEIARYKNVLKMANKYGLKEATMISMGKAFNYLQLCICYMVAYYFSVRLFLLDDFEPEYITMILSTQIIIIYRSTYMLNIISDLFMATDSAYRVMQFLDTKTNYSKSIEKAVVPDIFEANVSFKNVHFCYPTNLHTKVLNDLTLDIEAGKVTAVVGTSGAGKSTIVDLTLGLYDITAGQIVIGGVDIKKLNLSWLRNQIGIVEQEPKLFDTSIEENIRYGKTTATIEEIIEAAKISYAHGFIENLPSGYASIVGEGGIKLSGGQKQRIAIARAIVKKPKLLVLDEATSALDSVSEGIVQKALDNAMHDTTTLIIAHRMSTVRKADIIYAIKNGYVVEKGSHKELMKLKEYYYSLVKVKEKKEKALMLKSQGCQPFQEDLVKEGISFVDDNNVQVPESGRNLKINKENLKVIIIWTLAILFIIITSAFLPIFYYIFGLFCESYTHSKNELNGIALKNISFIFGLGIISFFPVVLSGVMSTMATQLWLGKLRNKAFNKIVFMDISWFDKSGNSPNECLEVMTNCSPLIESVAGDRAAQVIIFILSLLFSFGYSLFISASVTLINFPIILVFIILNCLRMKSRVADIKSASLATRSTKVATEYVQNVKTIQLLNCQKYVINQYKDILVLSKKEALISIIWYAVVYGMGKTLIRLSTAVTFIFEANDIVNSKIRGTLLISVMSALSFSSMSAGPVFVLMSQYPQTRQSLRRLYRITSTKAHLNKLTVEGDKPDIKGNIVFQDVMFSYPTRNEVLVLKKLNLQIEAGKSVALVGDSGCGKSTIISLLERFYLPDEGKILVDDKDINSINVRYLRSQMGLVSQEPVLFDMTIKENILYGLEDEVEMDKIIEAAKIANIHNFIMKLPLAYDTPVGDRGSKLSGGQKQRIAIARAILRNPKILLLDESTSALDSENEKAVQEALEKAAVGKTTIMVTHRLSTIRKVNKIVVLHSGAVMEEGNHEQLMEKKGYYFNMLNR